MGAIFRYFLFPLSFIYGFIVLVRNRLYDLGVFKSTTFDLPVICVGNLVVGGAGKTPTTEYLVRLLADYKIAILSRGYGRKTRGFVLADANSTALSIGDEPMQYYQKFEKVTVAVCEDRVYGINQLKNTHDVILLDDAYQHRAVKAGFNLLLFEFDKLLKWQFLLPMGNLRESFSGYRRADAVLITKSPSPVNIVDQINIRKKIDLRIDQRISFSSIRYGRLVGLFDNQVELEMRGQTLFLLTGIANPKPLVRHLEQFSSQVIQFEYPDHHQFTRENINALIHAFHSHPAKETIMNRRSKAEMNIDHDSFIADKNKIYTDEKVIITTEKDSKRLLGDNLKDLLLNLPIFYLPIEIELAPKDKFTFDNNILNYVARAKRIN